MIAGFETPERGAHPASTAATSRACRPQRRGVGMVFQSYALFPHLDVYENVAFGLKTQGARRRGGARAAWSARSRRVDLEGYAPPERAGALRRPAAARGPRPRARSRAPPPPPRRAPLQPGRRAARAHPPPRSRDLLKRVGITAVFVTHDQEEAFDLSDRIAVLRGGRLQQLGTPEELYREPANAFVASFVGRANFLAGRLLSVADPAGECERRRACAGRSRVAAGVTARRRVRVLARPEALAPRPRARPAGAPGDASSTGASPAPSPSSASRSPGAASCCSPAPRPRARRSPSPSSSPRRRPRVRLRPGGAVRRPRRGVAWLAVPVVLLLLWLVLYPNLFVLGDSLRGAGHLTLAGYRRFLASPAEREALWNSVWICLASVCPRGPRRRAARLPLHPLRLPRPPHPRRPRRPARAPPAARRRHRLPLPLRRERLLRPRRPAPPRPRGAALAAHRRLGDPAGPRLHDVRLLLPLHQRRPRPPRRRLRRGRRRPRRLARHRPPPRHPPHARPRPRRRRPPGLHDLHGLLQRPLRLRRRLPRPHHPDLRQQAERRHARWPRWRRWSWPRPPSSSSPPAALRGRRAYTGAAKGAAPAPPRRVHGRGRRARPHRSSPGASWAFSSSPTPPCCSSPSSPTAPGRRRSSRPSTPSRTTARSSREPEMLRPAAQLAADGHRRHARQRRPRLRRRLPPGPAALPRPRPPRRAGGPPLGPARHRARHRPRHHLQRQRSPGPAASSWSAPSRSSRSPTSSATSPWSPAPRWPASASSTPPSRRPRPPSAPPAGPPLRRVALPLVLPGLAAGALLAFVTALGEFVASILLYTHRTRPISMAILSELRAFDFGARRRLRGAADRADGARLPDRLPLGERGAGRRVRRAVWNLHGGQGVTT